MKSYKFSELIEEITEYNTELKYGLNDIVGVTIEKALIPTIANLTQTSLEKFYIVKPNTFVYNPRTHGVRLGMGYNQTERTYITTWNNFAFKVKDTMLDVLNPDYLWMYFNRSEWDRETNFKAWGSSTIVFSWNIFMDMSIKLPEKSIQDTLVKQYTIIKNRIELKKKINDNLVKTTDAIFFKMFLERKPEATISFTDVIQLMGGGTPKTEEDSFWNGDILFFTPKDVSHSPFCISTEKHLTDEGLNNCSSRLYPQFTTFVTCRGTVGNLAMAGVPMAMNQSCYALNGKDAFQPLFVFSFTRYVITTMKKKASGAVFSALVTRDFEMEKVFEPNIDDANLFQKRVEPIFARILANTKEIQQLSDLQNALLAQLSSR